MYSEEGKLNLLSNSGRSVRRLFRHLRRLPSHPIPEQFDRSRDLEPQDWAKSFLLVATTQRSGSHYLGHMLRETGEYGVPYEYLNAGNTKYWCRRFGSEDLAVLFPNFVRHRTSANGCFCLKAHWDQFAPFEQKVTALTHGVGLSKIIWLTRRNQLSQAISYVIARQTGAWVASAPERQDATYDYEAIVLEAERFRLANASWKQLLATRYPERHIQIIYEDLLGDGGTTESALQKFLGGKKPLHPSPRMARQRSSRNADWSERFASDVRDEHRWILEKPDWL